MSVRSSDSHRVTRLALAITGMMSVGACARPPYVEPAPNGGVVVRGARLGLYTKEVMTKKDPDTLVADDLTICRVPPDRYKSTQAHTLVYCNWQ